LYQNIYFFHTSTELPLIISKPTHSTSTQPTDVFYHHRIFILPTEAWSGVSVCGRLHMQTRSIILIINEVAKSIKYINSNSSKMFSRKLNFLLFVSWWLWVKENIRHSQELKISTEMLTPKHGKKTRCKVDETHLFFSLSHQWNTKDLNYIFFHHHASVIGFSSLCRLRQQSWSLMMCFVENIILLLICANVADLFCAK
jgi:hypothetical protein